MGNIVLKGSMYRLQRVAHRIPTDGYFVRYRILPVATKFGRVLYPSSLEISIRCGKLKTDKTDADGNAVPMLRRPPASFQTGFSMTGYTVHTGSNKKFSKGWDQIFTAQPQPKSAAKKSAAAKEQAAVKKSTSKKVKRGKQA